MSAQILEKIFGGSARVKVMKMFLFNPEKIFEAVDISSKTRVSSSNLNKELKILVEAGMIKKKMFSKISQNGKRKLKRIGFLLNSDFRFLSQLQNLLINNEGLQPQDIVKRLSRAGKIKMLVISGVFIQNTETRVDLLIVGDELKERVVKKALQNMEADIGKELRYTVLRSDDYKYRYNVCDRLIRDIFDYPHEVILDKLGL